MESVSANLQEFLQPASQGKLLDRHFLREHGYDAYYGQS